MKHTKKRVAALLLTLAMVLSLMPAAFAADTDFPDMPAEEDASYAAVKSAVDNEIMTGENGMLNLEGTILRSTVSKMVVTAFAAKGEADLSDYPDVADGAWYAEWMAKANQMGIMSGTSGKMRPSDEVTLQEVAAMLVRALGLEPGTEADLEDVPGAEDVAAWAIPWVAALVKANYISDVTGANQPMTRGAFAEVIYKVTGEGNYVKEAGEITTDVNGNIVITANGVSLKGITVTGDVIIADGVDAGSIVLDGVKIEGRLVVRGGDEAELKNGTTASATVVAKTSGEVTVKADDSSKTGAIDVAGTNSKAPEKVTLDMAEPNATISTDTTVAVQNAKGGEITMASANVSLSVESGTLDNVIVSDGMNEAKVAVAEGATIEKITTNTDLTVTGEGTVSEVSGSGVVSDESGEVIGGGDDEPANVPTISDAPFTSEEDTSVPSGAVAHTHNYDRANPKPYNATNHAIVCVDKAAVDATESTPAQAAIDGCGAVVYEPHVYSIACKPDGEVSETASENTAKKCVCGQVAPGTVTGSTVAAGSEEGDWNCASEDDHNWQLKTTTAATCTANGTKVYECTNTHTDEEGETKTCAATKTETIAKVPHNLVVDTDTSTAATCVADGTTKYKCTNSDCSADLSSFNVTVAKETVAHTVIRDTTQDQAATCTTRGVEGWKCSVTGCTADLNKDLGLSPNKHTFADSWTDNEDGTHSRTCTGCSNFTETKSHTWIVNAPAVAADCQNKGSTASYKCSATDCTATKAAEETPKTGHSYGTAWATSATEHWHECTTEGCSEKSGTATHTWSAVEAGQKAEGAYCLVCGYGKEGGSTGPTEPEKPAAHTHNWVKGECTTQPAGQTCTCPKANEHKSAGEVTKDQKWTCSECKLEVTGTKEETQVGQDD